MKFENDVIVGEIVDGERGSHALLIGRWREELLGIVTLLAKRPPGGAPPKRDGRGRMYLRSVKLLRYGRPVPTVFDLLGSKEDDMTYSLGFVVSRSPEFAKRLVERVAGSPIPDLRDGIVRLQTVAREHGRTDVEIRVGASFFGIFEAKRGPHLPTRGQLALYAPLLARENVITKRLVAVTNAPDAHAAHALPGEIDDIPVSHLSWRAIRRLAEAAREDESNHNKRLLDEFVAYLREILGMENSRSNMVYVVSLGGGQAWGLNFREVVERERRYFYPTEGGGWPEPPNYIAFRFDGRLQTIHHVDGFDIFTNPRTILPAADDANVQPHYCLRLGPPIRPSKEVPNGPRIMRNMRVWCMIDTLLTSATITDALVETKRRLGEDAAEADPVEEVAT
jgi:hypothetical protein